MQPSVIQRLEEMNRRIKRNSPGLTVENRTQVAWDFDLTEEKKIYSDEPFASDEEAAVSGYKKVELVDGKKRYYRIKLEPLDLTEEECAALTEALALSREPEVGLATGRFLMVFGILFVVVYVLGGTLFGAMKKSWLLFLLVSISGGLGGMLMYWVGWLIGEVHHLRARLLRNQS